MLLLAGTLDLGFSPPLDMLQSITMSQKVNNSQNACVILISRIWWSAAHCRSGHPPLQIHCWLAPLCPTAQGQLPGSELWVFCSCLQRQLQVCPTRPSELLCQSLLGWRGDILLPRRLHLRRLHHWRRLLPWNLQREPHKGRKRVGQLLHWDVHHHEVQPPRRWEHLRPRADQRLRISLHIKHFLPEAGAEWQLFLNHPGLPRASLHWHSAPARPSNVPIFIHNFLKRFCSWIVFRQRWKSQMMEFSVFDTLEIGMTQSSLCLSLEEGGKVTTKWWRNRICFIGYPIFEKVRGRFSQTRSVLSRRGKLRAAEFRASSWLSNWSTLEISMRPRE